MVWRKTQLGPPQVMEEVTVNETRSKTHHALTIYTTHAVIRGCTYDQREWR